MEISTLRISSLSLPSGSALDDHLFNPSDRPPRVQSLRACPGAIKNRVTSIEAERVFKIIESFPGRLVAAVHQPAPCLQQHSRSEESIRIPPMARATRRAAKTENAFPVTIDLASFLG